MAQPIRTTPCPPAEPLRERRFSYLTLNMKYTLYAWTDRSPHKWIQIAHKIAEITLFPFLLIAACEAIFKNGLFLLVNLGIGAANHIDQFIAPRRRHGPGSPAPEIVKLPPAPPPRAAVDLPAASPPALAPEPRIPAAQFWRNKAAAAAAYIGNYFAEPGSKGIRV